MDIWNIFDKEWVPVGTWVETALQWVVDNFRFVFQAIKVPFDIVLTGLEDGLTGAPDLLMIGNHCADWLAGRWPETGTCNGSIYDLNRFDGRVGRKHGYAIHRANVCYFLFVDRDPPRDHGGAK